MKHMSAVLKQKMESGDFTEEKESRKLQEAVTQQRPLYDSFYKAGMISRASVQAAKLFLYTS